MSEIIYMIFILPGFLIFTLLKMFFKGFGKKADIFDKTLYSIFFNIPVFLITIYTLNLNFIIKILKNINEDYNGIKKISELQDYFSNDINMLISLAVIILIVAIIVAVLWHILVILLEKINNKIRDYEIFNYADVWNSYFVEKKESIPVEVYKQGINGEELIVEGFLDETSVSLEEDIEFKIISIDSFKTCKEKGLLGETDYIYYNSDKNLKIRVLKMDKINAYLEVD